MVKMKRHLVIGALISANLCLGLVGLREALGVSPSLGVQPTPQKVVVSPKVTVRRNQDIEVENDETHRAVHNGRTRPATRAAARQSTRRHGRTETVGKDESRTTQHRTKRAPKTRVKIIHR